MFTYVQKIVTYLTDRVSFLERWHILMVSRLIPNSFNQTSFITDVLNTS